jgi:hypothetical protein
MLAPLTNFYFRVTETLQSQIRFCSGIVKGNPELDTLRWKRVRSIRRQLNGEEWMSRTCG